MNTEGNNGDSFSDIARENSSLGGTGARGFGVTESYDYWEKDNATKQEDNFKQNENRSAFAANMATGAEENTGCWSWIPFISDCCECFPSYGDFDDCGDCVNCSDCGDCVYCIACDCSGCLCVDSLWDCVFGWL